MKVCEIAHNVGCKDCNTFVYCPNWFDLDEIQCLIDRDITEEEFKEFVVQNEGGIADKVSELIRQELLDYF
jgi:hypothetical protein